MMLCHTPALKTRNFCKFDFVTSWSVGRSTYAAGIRNKTKTPKPRTRTFSLIADTAWPISWYTEHSNKLGKINLYVLKIRSQRLILREAIVSNKQKMNDSSGAEKESVS